ncbi:MAG: AMP-binding protein, partial [Salinisphaera sp.]|nr:AMP-binding protein [Salinisphaera sp.]
MTNPSIEAFRAARQQLLDRRGDYDQAYSGFRWPKLDRFNWALDWFDAHAAGNDRPALWLVDADGSEEKYSFEQMRQRSNQAANYLRGHGLKRGDTLLIMLDNVTPLWETMLACIKLGAVMIPASTLLSARDLEDRLGRGGVTHVLAGEAHTGKFQASGDVTLIATGDAPAGWQSYHDVYHQPTDFAPEGETSASDPLLLYFTSGTTSQPKLVLHTHQSYPVGHLSTMYWIGLRPDDIHLNVSSPGWAKHAWSNLFAPWNAGCTVFIYRKAPFSASDILTVIRDKGVTSLCAPPTVWRMLIQEDLSTWKNDLRILVGAGEPLNPEVISQVKKAWNLDIRDGYGQTETTAQIGNPPGEPIKPGSMGKPLPGYQIALLDTDDNPADEGEIAIDVRSQRPLGLMETYRGDPERMKKALHGGFYRTGDVASRDERGYYTYVGRADDVFKSSDYRISPFELESVMIEHAAVAEAAVVPSPDPVRLSVPKAYIVLAAGYEPNAETAKALFTFISEH